MQGLVPGKPVLEGLEDLCRDSRNVVFVVSGRGKDELEGAFGHIKVKRKRKRKAAV